MDKSKYIISSGIPKHPPPPEIEDCKNEASRWLSMLKLNGRNEGQVLFAISELERLSSEVNVLREHYEASMVAWESVTDILDDEEALEATDRLQSAEDAVLKYDAGINNG